MTKRLEELIEQRRHDTSTKKKTPNDEETKKRLRLIDSLAKEMPDDSEAYLDFNLDEDGFYIDKYRSMLNSWAY